MAWTGGQNNHEGHLSFVQLEVDTADCRCAPTREPVVLDSALLRIQSLGQSLRDLDAELDTAVAVARTLGLSWRNIGKAFGITRQGAQRRWKTVDSAERKLP